MISFTRRELHVIAVLLLIVLPLLFIVDQQTLDDWALAGMLFFVLPIGIYLVNDRERIEQINKSE